MKKRITTILGLGLVLILAVSLIGCKEVQGSPGPQGPIGLTRTTG